MIFTGGKSGTGMLILTQPNGTPITGWEDWTRPKKEGHWKPGRSAMELAKSWFRNDILSPPEELMRLLLSEESLRDLRLFRGVPELVTPLPMKGEGRNHDLWLHGETSNESVTICVEAKTDEPFGNHSISGYRQLAIARRNRGERTGAPERIKKLLEMVRPSGDVGDAVPYQLLTGICGTALQAQKDGSSIGVFVVHEFHTSLTVKEKIRKNGQDFKRFT
jgi:hypothetical protein